MVFYNDDGTARVYSHHDGKGCPINEKGVNRSMDAVGLLAELEYGGDSEELVHALRLEALMDEDLPAPVKPEPVKQPANLGDLMLQCPSEPMRELYREFLRSARYCIPEYGAGAVLAISSALIGPYWCRGTMLFSLIVQLLGPSQVGKNAPLQFAKSIVKQCGRAEMLLGDIASAEGLEDLIKKGPQFSIIDENSDKEKNDRSPAIRAKIREFATAGRTDYIMRTKAANKDEPDRDRAFSSPFLTLLMASTDASYGQSNRYSATAEGNLSRALVLTAKKRPPDNDSFLLNPVPAKAPANYLDHYRAVVQTPANGLNTTGEIRAIEVKLHPELNTRYLELAHAETKSYNTALDGDLIGAQTSGRILELTTRIACIAAVWDPTAFEIDDFLDDPEPTSVTLQSRHLEWAHEFVQAWRAGIKDYLEDTITTGDRFEDTLQKFVQTIKKKSALGARMIPKGDKNRATFVKHRSLLAAGIVPKRLVMNTRGLQNAKVLRECEESVMASGSIRVYDLNNADHRSSLSKRTGLEIQYRGSVYVLF
jgi:hypothetical protein